MLKMKLTDGKNTLYAIEYSSIPSLSVTLQTGTKIAIQNVQVVNGLLLLNATNTFVLGGSNTFIVFYLIKLHLKNCESSKYS